MRGDSRQPEAPSTQPSSRRKTAAAPAARLGRAASGSPDRSVPAVRGRAKRTEELARLWKTYRRRRPRELRNRLVEQYLPLVRYTAERLKACLPVCVDLQELVSAGMVGLIEAVEKFEPERGFRFETFCLPRLRGAMFDEMRAADWVPRCLRSRVGRLTEADAELTAALRRRPSHEELAAHLGLSVEEYAELAGEAHIPTQLRLGGGPEEENDLSRLDSLADRTSRPPDAPVELDDLRDFAFRVLAGTEAYVVRRYYFEGRSMREIGAELKVTESRICQIHAAALECVRKHLRRKEHAVLAV